jgi:dimethylaniline monooxygenase (N-oxide forming)
MPKRMAVIGAGAAGLCAAKHLLARGMQVTVYEIGSKVGGLWVYENDSGLSPAYESLHLNSENLVTAYSDFPFPQGSPFYLNHWQVHRYLESYAEHFDLRRHIRFNSKVVSLTPKWKVTLENGTQEAFDGVVVATGHQGVPSHPPFAVDFKGEYLHSHVYRVPEPFRGKRVLVVGMGNSAVDIAADICTVTASTTLAARSPVLIMPRMLFGKPASRFFAKVEKPFVPWPVRRWIRRFVVWMVHGRMEQWGFVAPKKRTHPTSHPSLMSHFVWNRIKGKPGIAEVKGTQVRFADGSVENFDTIIAATGYLVDLPFLPKEVQVNDGHWLNLYKRIVVPGVEGLYFVGFFNLSGGGNIRMMDLQSELVAAAANGDVDLPDPARMRADIDRDRHHMTKLYPDSPRYGLELDPREYGAAVRAELRRAKQRSDAAERYVEPASTTE